MIAKVDLCTRIAQVGAWIIRACIGTIRVVPFAKKGANVDLCILLEMLKRTENDAGTYTE